MPLSQEFLTNNVGFTLNQAQKTPQILYRHHLSCCETVHYRNSQNTAQPKTSIPRPQVSPHKPNADLVQLVHSGAGRYELALWNTTDGKHTIQNLTMVDLGEGEAHLPWGHPLMSFLFS